MAGPENVLVIGGGVIGLSCVAAIAKRGIQVTLLDASTPETVRSSRGDSRGLQFGCAPSLLPHASLLPCSLTDALHACVRRRRRLLGPRQ